MTPRIDTERERTPESSARAPSYMDSQGLRNMPEVSITDQQIGFTVQPSMTNLNRRDLTPRIESERNQPTPESTPRELFFPVQLNEYNQGEQPLNVQPSNPSLKYSNHRLPSSKSNRVPDQQTPRQPTIREPSSIHDDTQRDPTPPREIVPRARIDPLPGGPTPPKQQTQKIQMIEPNPEPPKMQEFTPRMQDFSLKPSPQNQDSFLPQHVQSDQQFVPQNQEFPPQSSSNRADDALPSSNQRLTSQDPTTGKETVYEPTGRVSSHSPGIRQPTGRVSSHSPHSKNESKGDLTGRVSSHQGNPQLSNQDVTDRISVKQDKSQKAHTGRSEMSSPGQNMSNRSSLKRDPSGKTSYLKQQSGRTSFVGNINGGEASLESIPVNQMFAKDQSQGSLGYEGNPAEPNFMNNNRGQGYEQHRNNNEMTFAQRTRGQDINGQTQIPVRTLVRNASMTSVHKDNSSRRNIYYKDPSQENLNQSTQREPTGRLTPSNHTPQKKEFSQLYPTQSYSSEVDQKEFQQIYPSNRLSSQKVPSQKEFAQLIPSHREKTPSYRQNGQQFSGHNSAENIRSYRMIGQQMSSRDKIQPSHRMNGQQMSNRNQEPSQRQLGQQFTNREQNPSYRMNGQQMSSRDKFQPSHRMNGQQMSNRNQEPSQKQLGQQFSQYDNQPSFRGLGQQVSNQDIQASFRGLGEQTSSPQMDISQRQLGQQLSRTDAHPSQREMGLQYSQTEMNPSQRQLGQQLSRTVVRPSQREMGQQYSQAEMNPSQRQLGQQYSRTDLNASQRELGQQYSRTDVNPSHRQLGQQYSRNENYASQKELGLQFSQQEVDPSYRLNGQQMSSNDKVPTHRNIGEQYSSQQLRRVPSYKTIGQQYSSQDKLSEKDIQRQQTERMQNPSARELSPLDGPISPQTSARTMKQRENFDWALSPFYKFILQQHVEKQLEQAAKGDSQPVNTQDASNYESNRQKLDQENEARNLNPNMQDIYTEMETIYMQSLVRKKSTTLNDSKNLEEIQNKSMATLEVLTKNMIAGEIPLERIFEFYKVPKRENVIKLLLRSRKLYEARTSIRSILILLIQKDEIMVEVDQVKEMVYNKDYVRPEQFICFSQAVQILQKLVRELNSFVDEHKLFKQKFIFNAEEQHQKCTEEFKQIQEFIVSLKSYTPEGPSQSPRHQPQFQPRVTPSPPPYLVSSKIHDTNKKRKGSELSQLSASQPPIEHNPRRYNTLNQSNISEYKQNEEPKTLNHKSSSKSILVKRQADEESNQPKSQKTVTYADGNIPIQPKKINSSSSGREETFYERKGDFKKPQREQEITKGSHTIQVSPQFRANKRQMEEFKTPHDKYNYEKTKYNTHQFDSQPSDVVSSVSDKSGKSFIYNSNRESKGTDGIQTIKHPRLSKEYLQRLDSQKPTPKVDPRMINQIQEADLEESYEFPSIRDKLKNSPSEAFEENLEKAQQDQQPEMRNSQKDQVSFGQNESDQEYFKKNPTKQEKNDIKQAQITQGNTPKIKLIEPQITTKGSPKDSGILKKNQIKSKYAQNTEDQIKEESGESESPNLERTSSQGTFIFE